MVSWACVVLLTALVATPFGPASARAAELRLRAECRSEGPVVTLGDVAEVVDVDFRRADALAAMELFPAPPPGQPRFVRLREIQDLLIIRGINLVEHRFSGSSQVTVLGPGEQAETGRRPLSVTVVKRAERQVCEAVIALLRERVSKSEPWDVDVRLDDGQARLVARAGAAISARGGMPPWEGPQRFEVTVKVPEGPVRFAIDARVTLPPAVVVAARSLLRGTVIRADDVQLQRGGPDDTPGDSFQSIAEVVNQETTRAIPAGKILERNLLRAPLVIQRGEVVTVYARSSGIRVRTTARARENGSLGDLILVESLLDRKAYYVRVSGIQEAEVYARAIRADRPAATGPAGSGRESLAHGNARSW